METVLAAIVVFGLVMLAMSFGVLVQGRRLRGSCGGTGAGCQCSPLAAKNCPIRRDNEASEGASAGSS